MARTARREKELTIEEKLEQALVPEAEQPYPVPENWCWVWHNSILDISGGSQPDKSLFIPEPKTGYTQLYQTRDYGEHPIPVFIPDKYATKTTVEGDILLARYGGSLGKVFKAHAGAYNVALAKVITLRKGTINNELLFYYYLSHFYQDFCVKAAYGRSAQAGFNRDDLDSLMFPLPPLAEQQRIVDRIESLFAKLDEAKEKAHAVVDGYEDRKAAILHKAFLGELTAEWRKENGISIESWFSQNLKESCTIGSGGTPSRKNSVFYNGDIPWVKTGEIDWNDIYDTEEHISLIATNNSSAKVYPEGSVLVAMYGMGVTRGRAAILRVNAATNQAVCVLQPNEYLINHYLFYYFMRNYWDIREQAVGGNQLNLSGTIISKLTINIPSVDEQYEIIKILDLLFEKEQRIKETSEQVIDQIDAMKKTILARAFRGELGTNNLLDEKASVLLGKVL